MSNQGIDPGRVLAPTQLLAAVLVLLVVSVPAFITGAATVGLPGWVPGMFAVAAVVDVPLTMLFVYQLLTRHRQDILRDDAYERMATLAHRASRGLDASLAQAGVDTESLVAGTAAVDRQVLGYMGQLEASVGALRDLSLAEAVPLDAELNLGRALMAERRWAEAAEHLDRYAGEADAGWEVHYVRGVAHANTRGGTSSDIAALRAYGDAIALLPSDAEPDLVARLFTYRAAAEKRLGRYEQAEADLLLARRKATADYEVTDIAYNLASVYTMAGRRDDALTELRRLRDLDGIGLVRGHLDDYFRSLRDDPDFREVTGISPL
ncbi:tetratricopeptide repeat protein [Actinacidiphila yeochonensis]|uniref:tetratricopeptide repeat protein n=1 Tax=Actinacidiphila yeochonensis TaxID=89050 RepID=UPI00055D3469|nr:tetratricopeptide repeat protein [Actinacidiphila yeochonensis]